MWHDSPNGIPGDAPQPVDVCKGQITLNRLVIIQHMMMLIVSATSGIMSVCYHI